MGEGTERRTALWPLFVLPALAAGFGALDDAGRSAIVPNLVQRSEVSTANAIFQALFQFGLVAGPAALRGRLSGLQIAVVTGGPRIGDLESGVVATAFGDTVSVVSGGLACIAGALVLARVLPGFRQQRTPEHFGQSRTLDTAPTGRDPSE